MTWEEAIKFADHAVNMTDIPEVKEFYRMCASSLRPVRREQVEKVWMGEWKIITTHNGCTPDQDCVCSRCGANGIPNKSFCDSCGAPMTDKAVDMVMERLEALKDGSTTD